MRSLGVTDALAGAVPHVLVPLLAAFTHVGDAAVLIALVATVHWFGPRYGVVRERDGARLLAVGLALFGAVVATKAFFALGRPPASVMLVHETGYGFPSGHATAAAGVYGAGAAVLRRPRRRVRWAVGGFLVVAVAASRLLLGVHYLVDVLAGLALGAVGAWVVLAVAARRLEAGFGLGLLAGACALALAWPTTDALGSFGLAVGGFCGSLALVRVGRARVGPALALVGYVVFGGLAVAALKAPLPVAAVGISSCVAGAGVVSLPALASAMER